MMDFVQYTSLEPPPQSPDINPIENLYNTVDINIRKRQMSNKNNLKKVLLKEWVSSKISLHRYQED